jgi:hypothetical protein
MTRSNLQSVNIKDGAAAGMGLWIDVLALSRKAGDD